ncbi:calmodulin-interacting protein 111-like [Papaver somniferum]|uniref:calmodulin-interacting protein 111-like n=1 Tax=Papaver somniferum TaxID=3469 RepID=UPI000E6F4BD9|nr:calmodulin-interacting protein 111-like [Papaver somniferum]
MPSKPRKNSKTPPISKQLSYSADSVSSSARKTDTEFSNDDEEEEFYASLLEIASTKFPSLISKSAFVGQIHSSKPYSGSNAATIWLSESPFFSSSITPGSIVSVSLASSRKKLFSDSPLESLSNQSGDDRVGIFFALARAYPSSEIVTNCARLSWSLSCTLGLPAPGKTLFIHPIQTCFTEGTVNGTDKLLASNVTASLLPLCNCKYFNLELVALHERPKENDTGLSVTNSRAGAHQDRLEIGESSPKTPVTYQPKHKPPGVTLERYRDSVSTVRHSGETLSVPYDISEAAIDRKKLLEESFGDKCTREIYQTCAKLWLHDRLLLHGNLVAIPMCKETYFFSVMGTKRLLTDAVRQKLVNGGRYELSRDEAQYPDLDQGRFAFFLDAETEVHLCTSLSLSTQNPYGKHMPLVEVSSKDITEKEGISDSKLGGLSKEFGMLKEIIVSSSVNATLSSMGLRPTKGVLLYGPPGTGKTSLAKSCVRDAGVNLFSINGPEIISQFHGESEQALHEIFDSATRAAPAVVFIDELDAIAPARKDGGEELSQRMVATLLNLMDGASRTEGVLVIAASNRPDTIDPALRRPGRLDREIEIGVPSPKQRLDILLCLLNGMDHSLTSTQVENLASATHGFVGSDLSALCNEAALVCLRHFVASRKTMDSSRQMSGKVHSKVACLDDDSCTDVITVASGDINGIVHITSSSDQEDSASTENVRPFGSCTPNDHDYTFLQNSIQLSCDKVTSTSEEGSLPKVTFDDFEKAKMRVRPSAMREVTLEVPKVRWDDVGGQIEAKKQLIEAVEWPQKHRDAFKRIGSRPPTGVLMFGPPGCSKTLLARAVASQAGLNFLAVKGPELFSKWVGESEKAVRSVFAKARANAPSIIFFDEIDGLAIVRGQENDGGASVGDRVMSQLLVELDGLHQRVDVTVIAATNRPDKIDSALLRPGRFDRLLYVGPPNETDREDIFHIHIQKMPCGLDVSIRELSILTDGCTGADISLICREAALAAIEESPEISEISMAHFETALERVQPSDVQSSQDLSRKFQRLVSSSPTRDDVEPRASWNSSNQVTIWSHIKSHLPATLLGLLAAVALSKAR